MFVDYSKYPRPESIAFFEKAISRHSITEDLERIQDYYYCIYRKDMHSINTLVTNHYTLGLVDYYEIIEQYPKVQAIVTISKWNGYTYQVKEEAKKKRIGIFRMDELLGALNWNEPHKYVKKDRDRDNTIFGRP